MKNAILNPIKEGIERPVVVGGDPGGIKASTAGRRGVAASPMSAVRRLAGYARQDEAAGGRERMTPKRRRRINKKLRARGVQA